MSDRQYQLDLMTPDQTATLLAQILDHPRVKAYGEARGWWAEVCEGCELPEIECDCYSHGSVIRYTGPDLALYSNLHELLGLADAIGWCPCTVEWECPGPEAFKCEIDYYDHDGDDDIAMQVTAYGPTRTLAVLAALGRALGIDQPS